MFTHDLWSRSHYDGKGQMQAPQIMPHPHKATIGHQKPIWSHPGGSVSWVSDSWFRLGSWCWGCGVEPCVGLCTWCRGRLRFSASPSPFAFPLLSLSLCPSNKQIKVKSFSKQITTKTNMAPYLIISRMAEWIPTPKTWSRCSDPHLLYHSSGPWKFYLDQGWEWW